MNLKTNLTGRIGRWSAEHPWRSIAVWLLLVVLAVFGGGSFGSEKLAGARAGSGSSGRAGVAADKAFSLHASEQVLIRSTTKTADDPAFRAAVTDVVERVAATGLITDLHSPYARDADGQISADRRSAVVAFQVVGKLDTASERVAKIEAAVAAAARDHPAMSIREAGDASISKAVSDTVAKDFTKAERLSLPITLFVLLFTFGALVAAVLPLALALTAVAGAMGLLAFASHINPISDPSNAVLLCIGLAVGVDYSLFYLKREREERAKGLSKRDALIAAASTSGRSVLVSGVTVTIAMAGMFLSGSPVMYGMGWAAILVVITSVVGSLTVLPAMLTLLGDKVNSGRIPLLHRRVSRDNRAWGWVLDRALRRPVVAAAIAGAALLALAAPVLGMKLANPSASDLPQTLPVLATYNDIQRTFPGGPTPALIVVQASDVTSPAVQAGVQRLEQAGFASGALNPPAYQQVSRDHSTALLSIPLAGNGEDARSVQALKTLRNDVIPKTVGALPGVTVDVSGTTAMSEDFTSTLQARLPLVIGFVLLLAFVFLLVAFRSVVIAATSIVLNLLSVAAAYGVLVLVFQHGFGEGVLGFESFGAVTAWLPLFLFVVLFGLSMDYQVFILSRIREQYDRGRSTTDAISNGIKTTAGTVTAAAVVMVFVFLTFARLSQVSMKELGVGLATAILLDATLVRALLLPSVMKLLGSWNWYLPQWLEWLPQVDLTHSQESTENPVSIPAQVVPAGLAASEAG